MPGVSRLNSADECPFTNNFSAGFDFKVKLKNQVLNLYSGDCLDTKTITVGEQE